ANSALLTAVTPDLLGSTDPLAGMEFQRTIERAAFLAGGGGYRAPVCLAGDFLKGGVSTSLGEVAPSYRPGWSFAAPDAYLPPCVCGALRAGSAEMARQFPGFDRYDAVLTGVESRSSSPVRILRGEDRASPCARGLFPCGEGAG